MKRPIVFLLIIMISFFQYCASSKKNSAGSNSAAAASVTYAGNIQSTITANCSPCHIPPKGFKKALDTYDAAKGDINDIIARIQMNPGDKGFMPFKHAKLSDSVIHIFVAWKDAGMPEK